MGQAKTYSQHVLDILHSGEFLLDVFLLCQSLHERLLGRSVALETVDVESDNLLSRVIVEQSHNVSPQFQEGQIQNVPILVFDVDDLDTVRTLDLSQCENLLLL